MTCAQLILKDKPKLKALWFEPAGVGDFGAALLAKLITDEPRLQGIRAGNGEPGSNKITMAGAQLLVDAFSANTDLTVEIDIEGGLWDEPQRLIDQAGQRGQVDYDDKRQPIINGVVYECDDKGQPIVTAPIRAVKKAFRRK